MTGRRLLSLRDATMRRPARKTAPAPRAKPPRIDADTADFYEALQEVLRAYQFRDRDRSSSCGLSVNQCYALEAIDRWGPLTVNDVAARLALDKSSASRIVSSLETAGLVRRSALPSDGRVAQLDATREGAELHARIRAAVMEGHQALLSDFEPEVRRALTRLLRRLARSGTRLEGVPAGTGTRCR